MCRSGRAAAAIVAAIDYDDRMLLYLKKT